MAKKYRVRRRGNTGRRRKRRGNSRSNPNRRMRQPAPGKIGYRM